MFAKCPAGRPGTADEVANIAELLMPANSGPETMRCKIILKEFQSRFKKSPL